MAEGSHSASVTVMAGICTLTAIPDAHSDPKSKTRGAYLRWRNSSPAFKINFVAGCFVLAFLVGVIVCFPPWVERELAKDSHNSDVAGWLFWIQTFAGNWSPPPDYPDEKTISRIWLSRLGVVALVINAGALYFLIGIFSGMLKIRRRQTMNLKQAFDIWKEEAKFEVAQALDADDGTAQKIDAAIEKSQTSLRPLLAAAFGSSEIDILFKKHEL